MAQPVVSIIMGSASDLPVMEKAGEVLKELEVPFEMTVVSAHRTPERMVTRAAEAAGRGVRGSHPARCSSPASTRSRERGFGFAATAGAG